MILLIAACLAGQSDASLPRGPTDWKVEVVARFPAVRHATVVCAAPDGRIFVGEDPQDMEGPVDQPLGRVLCLHPEGRITVFAQNLGAVFGLQYVDGRLYVHHVPKLTVFRDDDGVGRDPADLIAATHPEPSRGNRYNTHIPSGFRLAMDGHFYMAVGDKGIPGAVGRDGRTAQLRGGGVLRLRPDGTGLEVFCTGTRTFMDVAVGPEDDLFAWDNDDNVSWGTRVLHLVEGGYYGYPWDRGRPWSLGELHEGRGVPAGALAWTEDGLPPEYDGNLFFCEWGRSQIVRMRVERQGAGWRLISREVFATRGTEEFRPVGIASTPDGRGFVVGDWNTARRLTKGEAGRVLKFTYTGPSRGMARPPWFVPAASGRAFEATNEALIQALAHPARDVRLVAQRRLADRRATDALKTLALDDKASPLARTHALWALDDPEVSARLSEAAVPLRRQALRHLALRRGEGAGPILSAALRDPDASVRFAAATGLGRISHAGARDALIGALEDGDSLVRHAAAAALATIGRNQPSAWASIARGLRSGARREAAVAALHGAYDEEAVAAVAEAARDASLDPGGRAAAVMVLAELRRRDPPWEGGWWGTRPALNPRPARTQDWAGTPAATEALRSALADPDPMVARATIEGIRSSADQGAVPPLRALFPRTRDSATRRAILETLEALRDPELGSLAAASLADPALVACAARLVTDPAPLIEAARRETAPNILVPVLEALARHGGGASEAAAHLKHGDPAVRRAAIRVAGRAASAEAIRTLLGDPDAAVRRAAVQSLGAGRSRDSVPELLRVVDDPEVRPDVIDALAQIPDLRALDLYLEGLGGKSPGLRASCRTAVSGIAAEALPHLEKRLESLPAVTLGELQRVYAAMPSAARSPLLARSVRLPGPSDYLAFALAHPGSADRGRKLYEDPRALACTRCHSIGGRGGDIGPELSLVGALYDRAYLAESVLFPSAIVAGGYRQTIVRTRDGEILSGLPRRETAEALVLVDAEERPRTIRKADIEVRRVSDVSIMPEGLAAGMSLEEFADLVAFLESLTAEK